MAHGSAMKRLFTLGIGGCATIVTLFYSVPSRAAEPSGTSTNLGAEIFALRTEVARLKSVATDQSHVMADVGYHFANLWFAGDKQNWPLAKFYFDETRAHINWSVRVIPIRKDSAGREVDLKAIWEPIDASLFKEIGNAIEQKNREQFATAYRGALPGCYACHKASSKPYLRPQIPTAPPQPIINFDPEAKWPE
jgi:hypothetical protein